MNKKRRKCLLKYPARCMYAVKMIDAELYCDREKEVSSKCQFIDKGVDKNDKEKFYSVLPTDIIE